MQDGLAYLILDGRVVAADRCLLKTTSRKGEAIDLWYSGKTHDFGGNIQAIFDPRGIPLWVSDVLPGNVHDLAAALEPVFPVLRAFLSACLSWLILATAAQDRAGPKGTQVFEGCRLGLQPDYHVRRGSLRGLARIALRRGHLHRQWPHDSRTGQR